MTKKNPSLGRKGVGQNLTTVRTNTTSNLAYHPSVDRLTSEPWSKPSSLIIDAFLADQLDLFPVQSFKPQIRSVGITPSCRNCGCKRGYLYKGELLCCRCDRPVTGGSN